MLLKTLIIGGILYLATRQPAAFLLALTVAQIDPLAVANLLTGDSSHLSDRARTILSAWSSFDDPMTVLLSIYALYFFIPHTGTENLLGTLSPFFLSLAQNLIFAALIFWLSHRFKDQNTLLTFLLGLRVDAGGDQERERRGPFAVCYSSDRPQTRPPDHWRIGCRSRVVTG